MENGQTMPNVFPETIVHCGASDDVGYSPLVLFVDIVGSAKN
jgi:hypothetical protein